MAKQKHQFFKLMESDNDFCTTMKQLGQHAAVHGSIVKACEKAICKLYKHDCDDINLVRYDMISSGADPHEVPPSHDALELHIQRANYQALIWRNATYPNFLQPTPNGNGWVIKDDCIDIMWIKRSQHQRLC